MLNSPASGLNARQKHHRRQNSTPTAFEGVKVPGLTTPTRQRPAGGAAHRRGQSLDIRQQQQKAMRQLTVSNTNNLGSANIPQHYDLREAQQQSTQARPGMQQELYSPFTLSPCDQPLMSPLGTPQMCSGLDSFAFSPMNGTAFGEWDMMAGRSSNDFDLYSQSSGFSTPVYTQFPEGSLPSDWSLDGDMTSRGSRRSFGSAISSHIERYENLSAQGQERPSTPPERKLSFQLPMTPMETPEERMEKHAGRPDRFAEGYDESMEETLKPVRGRGLARAADIFRQQVEQPQQQQQPQQHQMLGIPMTAAIAMSRTSTGSSMGATEFSDAELMSQFVNASANFDGSAPNSVLHTPMSQNFFGDGNDQAGSSQLRTESPTGSLGGHRRNQSQASIVSAQSIADIKIDEALQETGVTLEEIEQFISGGPGLAEDNKYICTFEECGKTFGRKENIKSHVQTHLDDRKFLCQHCKKCFVRLHDLKRHAKIHTGIKPYVCQCGRDFARHDALTRHRQRGMCIGSFEGAVRSSAKRGRPKKPRPDLDARQEKAARTRKKNLSISSISSSPFDSSSGASAASTPRDSALDLLNFDASVSMPSQGASVMASSAPMPTPGNGPTRPQAVSSPVQASEVCVSPQEIMEALPSHPSSPAKSIGTQHNTPELSQSPSPGAAHSHGARPSSSSSALLTSPLENSFDSLNSEAYRQNSSIDNLGHLNVHDDLAELLFLGDDDNSYVQLDSTADMILSSKSSHEFDDSLHMFGEPDDMYAM